MSDFAHPAEHEGKSAEELVRDLEAELAEFGRQLQDLGTRLQTRPERVTTNEVFALVNDAVKAYGRLDEYRRALVNTWRLEDPPTRQLHGE